MKNTNCLTEPINPYKPYKSYSSKPTRLELEELRASYFTRQDYLHDTADSPPSVQYVWYRILGRANALLNNIGWNGYAECMLEGMQTIAFTVAPDVSFQYNPILDRIELNLWNFLFGESDSGFLYKDLRFKPVFEQTAVLVHEFTHHVQDKRNKMIGKSEEETSAYISNTYPQHEIDALLTEQRLLKDYAKFKGKGLYKVQCCKIKGWKKAGYCNATFSTTWEQCNSVLTELQEAINEQVDDLKKLTGNEKENHLAQQEHNRYKVSKEFQAKLKLPINAREHDHFIRPEVQS